MGLLQSMRKSTLTAEIVAVDKATKNINTINKAAQRMTNTMVKESKVAGNAFSGFGSRVGMAVKKANVALNNLNAKVNRVGRNIKNALGTFGLAVGFTAVTMAATSTIGVFADFEQANAGLTAVMGTTLEQNEALIVDSKRLGATTAKTATEVVGLQEAFARLGFQEDSIINMTEATISGSVAMQGELADTAELVGAMVKSFDNFESVDAPGIIDKLTLATQKSALNFEKLQTGLPIVAGAANAAKVPFTKLLASMGKLSDAGIDASSSTTALRNIYLEAAKQGVPYEQLIDKVANSTDQLATANELFGKRGAVAAVILAKNIAKVNELDVALQSAGGTAATAAAKQLDTLKGSITILGSAWEGYVLSVEDGNGAMGEFLKTSIRVVTDILSIASGTAKAKDQLTEAELRIRNFAETGIKVLKLAKNLGIAFVAFKVAVFGLNSAIKIVTISQKIWQTYQAVSLALQGKTLLFLQGNTAATLIYSAATKVMAVSTKIATIAQTAWAVAMNAGIWPITLIIAGIAALVIGIRALVKHWDVVKNAVVGFYDKIRSNAITDYLLMPIISIVESVKLLIKSFKDIKAAFQFGGLVEGFKAIGKSILNFMILPFKLFLETISKIPKVGKFAQTAVDKINKFQESPTYDAPAKAKGVIKEEIIKDKANNTKLVEALNKNTDVIKSTEKIGGSPWKGRFETSILKNENVGEGVVNNQFAQKSVTNNTTYSNNKSGSNSEITINVVDKTGSKYGVEVESTGVEVITTGNA